MIMRRKIKFSIYGVVLLALTLFVVLWSYNEINRPVEDDVSMVKNVGKVNAEEIISMFKSNEQEANATYIEKVIEVEGVVKNISFLNNRHTILLESKKFTKSFVMCDMSPLVNKKIHKLKVGDSVVLKGVCKGYLLDVIMLNCLPTNEKTEQ